MYVGKPRWVIVLALVLGVVGLVYPTWVLVGGHSTTTREVFFAVVEALVALSLAGQGIQALWARRSKD